MFVGVVEWVVSFNLFKVLCKLLLVVVINWVWVLLLRMRGNFFSFCCGFFSVWLMVRLILVVVRGFILKIWVWFWMVGLMVM